MLKKRIIAHGFILAAFMMASGCGSSEYSGFIKLRYEACKESQGKYEVIENGKDRCSCYFTDDAIPYTCPEGYVCDSVYQRCVKCEEGKSFCVDGWIHICLNGDWQVQHCESNTCFNDNSCFSTALKPMCCKDANDNSICGDSDADKGILVVMGNAYALDECANGCTNGACLPCNGFESQCKESQEDDALFAELVSCQNGFKRISQCSSNTCNADHTACGDILPDGIDCSGKNGQTRCISEDGSYKQQICQTNTANQKDEWTTQKVCELGCNAEKNACVTPVDEPTDNTPCQEKKFKCEYDSANEAYHLFQCKNKVWNDLKLCPYGCVIDANTQEGYCKDHEAPPQPKCIQGTYRCQDGAREKCIDNTWTPAPCEEDKLCVSIGDSKVECQDKPCEQKCETTSSEMGRIVCENGDPKATHDCPDGYSCNTSKNDCGECTNKTYQCKMGDADEPILSICNDGSWQAKTDESCPKCISNLAIGSSTNEVCDDKPPQNKNCENGYYKWDETEKKIKLCANDEWVEDIPEYNNIFTIQDKNKGKTVSIWVDPHNYGYTSTLESTESKFYTFLTSIPEGKESEHIQATGFKNTPFIGCHDNVIFYHSNFYINSYAWNYLKDSDDTSTFMNCTYGCNSNRTKCVEDIANATSNDIFMSYYYTKEEPFDIELYRKGKKLKETQCTAKGSLQYVCSGSDHQNTLGNQFCIDAYHAQTYVRTSLLVEKQTENAGRKYKLTKCTSKSKINRCNTDWSACATE